MAALEPQEFLELMAPQVRLELLDQMAQLEAQVRLESKAQLAVLGQQALLEINIQHLHPLH
jgi:hypothetical protein